MGLSNFSVDLYRRTVKRFQPAHVASHWLMERVLIPLLETGKRFRTIPDDPFWFRLELLTGRHEVETTRLLDQLVLPGMTMLDIGAHVGYYTRRYAPQVGSNGRLIAFEPHPRTFRQLQHNVGRFGNVTALQLALAEAPGTAELHDYLIMSASGSLQYDQELLQRQQSAVSDKDIAPRIGEGFSAQTFTVETKRVDDCLSEMGIERVDVAKMDIEGAELSALRGMRETIARSPHLALVMEYNPPALHGFGHDPQQALQEVLALGFARVQAIEADGSLADLTHNATAVRQRTQQLWDSLGVVNLLFTKK